MEEPKERVSFRIDKKSEALSNVKVNKFGHTITGNDEKIIDDGVQLKLGGVSGVEAYVDIFDSPTMKKFMQQNNLDLDKNELDKVEIIDLSEENDYLPEASNFSRPDSLEEFDKIADEVMGVQNSPKLKKVFAQDNNQNKVCNSCQCKNKMNSKFCSNCGKPFLLASFCKNCGNKFESVEKFCSECGTKRE